MQKLSMQESLCHMGGDHLWAYGRRHMESISRGIIFMGARQINGKAGGRSGSGRNWNESAALGWIARSQWDPNGKILSWHRMEEFMTLTVSGSCQELAPIVVGQTKPSPHVGVQHAIYAPRGTTR